MLLACPTPGQAPEDSLVSHPRGSQPGARLLSPVLLAGVKAMSEDRGLFPSRVTELVPSPVSSLHSLLTGEKRFFPLCF